MHLKWLQSGFIKIKSFRSTVLRECPKILFFGIGVANSSVTTQSFVDKIQYISSVFTIRSFLATSFLFLFFFSPNWNISSVLKPEDYFSLKATLNVPIDTSGNWCFDSLYSEPNNLGPKNPKVEIKIFDLYHREFKG